MKLQLAIVIGVILVGSIATVSLAFVQNNELSANTLKSTAGVLGHVTLTATDENGNVVAYRQTDNVIINGGDDCLIEDAFGAATNCQNTTNVFDDVHIGTTQTSFTEGTTGLTTWSKTTAGTVGAATAATGSTGAQVTVTASFLDVSASIAEAALYNSNLSSADVLALQSFSPISLGPTDDLTIQWTVAIDGN